MRILFELALFAVVLGGVVVFYITIINVLNKRKKKESETDA